MDGYSQQQPQRGRGGKRSSKRRDFFSPTRIQQAKDKQDNVIAEVEQVKKDASNVHFEQTSNLKKSSQKSERINKVIETGKEFLSKFFQGFSQPERGNVKVTLEPTIDERLTEPYLDRLISHFDLKPIEQDKDLLIKKYYSRFKGIVNIGIAMKLQKSAPEFEKTLNHKLTSIRLNNVRLPKKMAMYINQLGKTNMLNDNRIRLDEHHLLVSKFILKGLLYYHGPNIDQYLPTGITSEVLDIHVNHYWDTCLDKTIGSLKILKKKGKRFFEDRVNKPFEFTIGHKKYNLKLPDFNFHDDVSISDIIAYFNNDIFVDFKFGEELPKIIGCLVFQVARFDWIANSTKNMSELDSKFAGTIIADTAFSALLSHARIWFVEDFLDFQVMDELVSDMIETWNNADSLELDKIYHLDHTTFSEYGSESQIVEVQLRKSEKNHLGFNKRDIKYRSPSEVVLKISEHAALTGLSLGYSQKVEIKNRFLINYDGNGTQIFREMIKSDFK
jgi:hypothetical protein